MKANRSAATLTLWILFVGPYGGFPAQDVKDSNCTGCIHECAHKYCYNPGMCWNNGGAGAKLCAGQSQANCPAANTAYYNVMSDFPQSQSDDPTTSCKPPGGTTTLTVWAAHTNISSPAQNCYQTVSCTWNTDTRACEIAPGSGGPWNSLPKMQNNSCPICL